MKARTKEEKLIEALKFPDIDFSRIKIFQRWGCQTNKGITCLKCGNTFTSSSLKTVKCPHCGEKLKVEKTRKQIFNDSAYIQVITTNDDYQVIRIFLAILEARKGQEENFKIVEVMRWFINPKGKIKLMTIATTQFFYEWRWVLNRPSKFEFKKINDRYNYCKWKVKCEITYPRIKFTDMFKYCGYSKKIVLSAICYFEVYLGNPKIELLAKLGRNDLIEYFYRHKYKDCDKYLKPVRTVIKTNYIIKDVGLWFDYIDALIYFDKDISSPRYACPENLIKAHDIWLEKKNWDIRAEETKKYRVRVAKYKGIDLGEDNIKISVIADLKQMYREAKLLDLCYITSRYYQKEESIILSAQVDGEPAEGIEVDLLTKTIIQIRGKGNRDSVYHKQIEGLVKKNLNKLFKPKKEEKQIEFNSVDGTSYEGPGTQVHEQQSSLCAI